MNFPYTEILAAGDALSACLKRYDAPKAILIARHEAAVAAGRFDEADALNERMKRVCARSVRHLKAINAQLESIKERIAA